MSADFDKPTVGDEYVNILADVRDNQEALAKMFSDGSEANIPTGAVRFLNNQFSIWNGSSWVITPISIGGGGTGSSTAATARTALGANNAANLDTGTLNADRVPVLAVDTKTSGDLPLTRTSGTLTGTKVDQANTSQRGTVQLNNTLTSTSTTEGLTAAQGKALKDTVDLKLTGVAGVGNSQFRNNLENDGRFLQNTNNLDALTDLGFKYGSVSIAVDSTAVIDLGNPVITAMVSVNNSLINNVDPPSVVWSGNNITITNSQAGANLQIVYWAYVQL